MTNLGININLEIRELVLEEMNKRFPQKEMDFSNFTVASIIAKGKSEKLNSSWVMSHLLQCVEDGFLTYGQAVYIKDKYLNGINEVKKMINYSWT